MSEQRVGDKGKRERTTGSTISGLVLAPLLGGALAAAVLALAAAIMNPSSGALIILHVSIMVGFIAGAVFGVPAALLVGLPMHLIMMRTGIVGRRYYATMGGVIAVLLCVTLSGPAMLTSRTLSATLVAAFALGGTVGGIVFWSIRRPDREEPAETPRLREDAEA